MSDSMLTNMTVQSGRIGGDTMTRKPRSPLNLGDGVTLRELQPGKQELRTRKPKDAKQMLFGSWADAQREAIEAHARVKLLLDGKRVGNPTISEALAKAIADGRGNEETVGRYVRAANKFQEWVLANLPGVSYWSELRPSHLKQYMKHLEGRGLARDSIRLAFLPIQKASRYWVLEYPRQFDEIARGVKLPPAGAACVVTLSLAELESVLSWILVHYPQVYPIAAFAGFMGMRLREVAGITNADLDLEAKTVKLQSNHLRKLKNETYSPRLVPLTARALEAITAYRDAVKLQTFHPNEAVFTNAQGGAWNNLELGNACRNANVRLKRLNLVPEGFCIRRLRSTFNTLCFVGGAREAFLQRFVGQTPTTIGRRHYLNVTVEDLRREIGVVFDNLGKAAGNPEAETPDNKGEANA